jgi:hypothetical protein
MEATWSEDCTRLTLRDTTPKGREFEIEVAYSDGGTNHIEWVGLTWLGFKLEDGREVGPISMGLRTKAWGEIYYLLTRGIEIPRKWFNHVEA